GGMCGYCHDCLGEQTGGLANVAKHKWFEVGWWGEGIEQAVDWLNGHAAQKAAVARLVQPIHVTWFRSDLWQRLPAYPKPATEWLIIDGLWIDSAHTGFQGPGAPADAGAGVRVSPGGRPK